jgi:hypothetical protein
MVQLESHEILRSDDGVTPPVAFANSNWGGSVTVSFSLSPEAFRQFDRLAEATGSSLEEVIGKALILFQVAAQAHLDGKGIAILDHDGNVEQQIIGFEGSQTDNANRPA